MEDNRPDGGMRGEALPGRQEALALLRRYTTKPGLVKHALAVEATMRAYARMFGEPEEAWGLVGLLHDFDYERWPTAEDHPYRGAEVLEREGYPDWFRRAVLSHADHTGVARLSKLEKTLFACDELCGFLTAAALVTPTKSLSDVRVKSVRKKMKSKAFAANVSREDIAAGAEQLGVELNEHIEFVLEAMRSIAAGLGLDGAAADDR